MTRRTLAGGLTDALGGADWLTPADEPAMLLAHRYASALDRLPPDPVAAARVLRLLGPKLLDLLTVLGLTPAGRRALGLDARPSRGRLGELRAARMVDRGGAS